MRNKKLIVIFSILLALTLLIVLNSVLFSVRIVTSHCFNYDDTIIENDGKKLGDKVIEAAGIKKGSSIFLVNKDKVAANIVARQTGVKVVNIEKRFPNRITIHYAKLINTFQVAMPRGYYICTNDGRIVDVAEKPLPSQNIINLRMSVSPDLGVGDYLDGTNMAAVAEVIAALDRLDYRENDPLALIDFIDVSVHAEIIYICTSGGIFIKIFGTDNLLSKLRYGLSLYLEMKKTHVEGMITVSAGELFTWSDKDDYLGV